MTLKINSPLKASDVYHQPAGIPENLIPWQDENSGIAALVQAGKDIAAKKVVTFAICTHEPHQDPIVTEIVQIGWIAKAPHLYENNEPGGALIASWYDYAGEPAAIAVALARTFAHKGIYFRLK